MLRKSREGAQRAQVEGSLWTWQDGNRRLEVAKYEPKRLHLINIERPKKMNLYKIPILLLLFNWSHNLILTLEDSYLYQATQGNMSPLLHYFGPKPCAIEDSWDCYIWREQDYEKRKKERKFCFRSVSGWTLESSILPWMRDFAYHYLLEPFILAQCTLHPLFSKVSQGNDILGLEHADDLPQGFITNGIQSLSLGKAQPIWS